MTEEQTKFLYLIADSIGTTAIEDFSCKAGEKMREIIKSLEQQSDIELVTKEEVLKQIKEWGDCEFVKMTNPYHYLEKRIQSMPPVTSTHDACKDCKHYVSASIDNTDNIYKTSYCRKHDKNVYREDFYCTDFKKRGNKVGWSSLENVRKKVERGNENENIN